MSSTTLATLNLTGITPEKFAVLQTIFTTEFKGGNHTATSGTFEDNLAIVDYSYDSKSVLTLSVQKINRHLFKKPAVKDVVSALTTLVEESVGKGSAVDTPVANLTQPVTPTPVQAKETSVTDSTKTA